MALGMAPFNIYKKEVILMSKILKEAIKALVSAATELVLDVIIEKRNKNQ